VEAFLQGEAAYRAHCGASKRQHQPSSRSLEDGSFRPGYATDSTHEATEISIQVFIVAIHIAQTSLFSFPGLWMELLPLPWNPFLIHHEESLTPADTTQSGPKRPPDAQQRSTLQRGPAPISPVKHCVSCPPVPRRVESRRPQKPSDRPRPLRLASHSARSRRGNE
jgi:hypothetical protein